jgi:hypothetical protein
MDRTGHLNMGCNETQYKQIRQQWRSRSQRHSLLQLSAPRFSAAKHHRSTTRAPLSLALLAAGAVFCILTVAVFVFRLWRMTQKPVAGN